MKKILSLLFLLLLVYLLFILNNKKQVEEDFSEGIDNIDEKSLSVAKKITNINANKISQQSAASEEPASSVQIRMRIPDLQKVISNTDFWKNVLNEEEFRIIRDLQNKVQAKHIFSEQDNVLVTRLEDKNILNAIRQNNPAMVVINQEHPSDREIDTTMPESQPDSYEQESKEVQPTEEVINNDPPAEQPEYVENNY